MLQIVSAGMEQAGPGVGGGGGGLDEVVAVLASMQPDQDRRALLEQVRPALSSLSRQQMQLGIQQVRPFESHGTPSLPPPG